MSPRPEISAFVITYNEENNIRECLESVAWVDEIVVVDSFSEDRTVEIAEQYADLIEQRPFPGHVDQTRYASEQTSKPWILWLDADERLTPAAREEIETSFEQTNTPSFQAFSFPRKTFFMGRWILHSGWYPQPKIRLWNREHGEVVGEEPHPRVKVDGEAKKLSGDILHYSYPAGMKDMVNTSTKYASYAARTRHEKGRHFSMLSLLLKPPGNFLKKYLLQLGILDGFPGFAIAVGAAYYRFMREVMMWELDHGEINKA
ncbi:MAG: glycosyltransferase family 2 protein [Planctomycetes bacterium]|nr:glycosyltransferase family 2 protein [Planctomycetota bacterium]